MAIIAALITASVALLVPFITLYLNRTYAVPNPAANGVETTVPITISASTRLLIVLVMGATFMVPVGFLAFCVVVVLNLFFAPPNQDVLLWSLDAGLNAGAAFALSLVWHAGLNEPRKWWRLFTWYPAVACAFFGSLGFVSALVGNLVFAWAVGNPEPQALQDSMDAAVASGVVALLAGYASVKVEELREGQSG